MARRRSGLQGVTRLRRTLRRIEPEASDEVRAAVREGSEAVVADALAKVPRDEGDLARSIDYVLGRDGLTSAIGPGAKAVAKVGGRTKAGAAFGFSARLAKQDRQAIAAAAGLAEAPQLKLKISSANKQLLFEFFKGYWVEYGTKGNASRNIPAQPARPFMRPAWDMNRAWLLKRVQSGLAAALRKAVR